MQGNNGAWNNPSQRTTGMLQPYANFSVYPQPPEPSPHHTVVVCPPLPSSPGDMLSIYPPAQQYPGGKTTLIFPPPTSTSPGHTGEILIRDCQKQVLISPSLPSSSGQTVQVYPPPPPSSRQTVQVYPPPLPSSRQTVSAYPPPPSQRQTDFAYPPPPSPRHAVSAYPPPPSQRQTDFAYPPPPSPRHAFSAYPPPPPSPRQTIQRDHPPLRRKMRREMTVGDIIQSEERRTRRRERTQVDDFEYFQTPADNFQREDRRTRRRERTQVDDFEYFQTPADNLEDRRKELAILKSRDEDIRRMQERTRNLFQNEERRTMRREKTQLNDFEYVQTPLDNARASNGRSGRQKRLPVNHVGIWKFGASDYFTSVPNRLSVSKCIRHVQEILDRRCNLDLWIKNRCIMLDKGKSLSDYAGLTKLHVVRRHNNRNPHPRYKTSEPDVTDPYGDDECVLMPCGHALSPENLFQYYWNKITSGNIEVRCPALPDENNLKCEAVWEFTTVRLLACLSTDERFLLLSVLFMNWLEKNKNVYLCPQCDEAVITSCRGNGYFDCYFCQRRGESYTFCIRCLEPVRPSLGCSDRECQRSLKRAKSLIRACDTRTLAGVRGCLTVRACPTCQCIIEYDDTESCKHMTCPNRTCRTRFCFICLSVPSRSGYYPCGGIYDQCRPAPRQDVR